MIDYVFYSKLLQLTKLLHLFDLFTKPIIVNDSMI